MLHHWLDVKQQLLETHARASVLTANSQLLTVTAAYAVALAISSS
jgi:hypothetical protein